jgi:tRNA A-37 threonylcarbamoyl transferase component Bud32
MGSVYLAQHMLIGKKVAVKFLHTKFVQKDEIITRFYREAQAAAKIGHQNIADVFDMGVSDQGEPYIIMEYLEGESLAKLISRSGPMDLGAVCGILEPTLLALDAAHAKGIIHRDLKPENIFLVHRQQESPIIKLIDFGVSKFSDGAQTHITATGSLLGTPAYMSPEQVRGVSDIDKRSDLYSVGVILYQLLTGRLPYDGEQYHELLAAALTSDPIPPRVANPAFPQEAETLVLKALGKNRDDRPESAREMLRALSQMPGFEERANCLRAYTVDLSTKTLCANETQVSDGKTQVEDLPSAAAYVQMVKQNRTGQWTNSSIAVPKKKLVSGRLGRLLLGGGVIGAIAVAVILFWGPGDSPQVPSGLPTPTRNDVEEEGARSVGSEASTRQNVQIDVRGAPPGAKIFYNNIPVPINPFRVDIKETITPLRVESSGYQTFVTSVVPSEDQVVKVEMLTDEEAERIVPADLEPAPATPSIPVPPPPTAQPKVPVERVTSKSGDAATPENNPKATSSKKSGTKSKDRAKPAATKDGDSGAKFKLDFD